jgi:2-C-methyl-D-erythritol 4-phosphate cytidylyltransferase/2-C-methyl-D-erythritol 2,4-cyclodiphosphate synthase
LREENPLDTAVIIVAAGRGLRMGGGEAKQWQPLAGRPMIAHSLAGFRTALPGAALIVVLPPDEADRAADFPAALCVPGGADRAASVRAGLEALAADPPEHVLIHDAARPLVSPGLIRAVRAALDSHEAAAPGLPVTDALWRVADGRITGTAPRDGLQRAQTPQGFRYPGILAAHRAHPGGAADDVAVALAAGIAVATVPGEARNLKVTLPGDMARAAALIGAGPDLRVGNGFDVHAFGPGDHLWLCGVRIPHDRGLVGHSDADVGLHAACDAIYGALAEGDIGRHFPPSDPEWEGADSSRFLAHAGERAELRDYRLTGLDITLICERPKIAPHAEAMRARIAAILGIGADRVSVKATTSERLGFTGREEGIAALATASLVKP